MARRQLETSNVDTRLRFVDGLVVEPSDCPSFIHARSHWRPGLGDQAVCLCNAHPSEPVVPDVNQGTLL